MPRARRRRVKGHGSVYKKGRTWSVSWVEDGVRQYSHGYPTKELAEEVRANNAVNVAAGRGGIEKKTKATALRCWSRIGWSAARTLTVRLATTGTDGRITSNRR